MTVRGTLALFGLLAVLVLVVLVDRPPVPSSAAAPLLGVPPSRVTRLEVAWPDARFSAERRDGTWRDPRGRATATDAADDLLATLAAIRPVDTLSRDGAEHGEYGFGPPGTSIVAFAGGEAVLRLDVGARNPSWTGVYVREDDRPDVVLVGSLLHWELEKLRSAATQ